MSTAVPQHFDAETRNRLAQAQEIQLERQRSGAMVPGQRTTIWVVGVGDDLYIRSVRGPAGRWYQAITANPTATVHLDGQRIAVRAIPVTDDATIERVSEAYRRKYRNDPSMPTMVCDDTLPTTLRVEPR